MSQCCASCGKMQVIYISRYGVAYCKKCAKKKCPKDFEKYQRSQYKKRVWDPKDCDYCRKTFVPKTANQIYCCSECSRKGNDEKTKRGRFEIFVRDKFTCIYCGKTSYSGGKELHVDHIVPRKSKGKDVASNLVTACIDCNLEKSEHRLPNEVEQIILTEITKRNQESGISPTKPIYLVAGALLRSERSY